MISSKSNFTLAQLNSSLGLSKRWPWLLDITLSDVVSFGLTVIGLGAILGGGIGFWATSSQPVSEGILSHEERPADLGQIVVSVTGAVKQPGLYTFQTNDRVAQAIEAAGGLLPEADQSQLAALNLAQKLSDGQHIHLKYFEPLSTSKAQSPTETSATSSLININTASQKELEGLPEVGVVRATSIIEHRPYASIDDLVTKEVMTTSLLNKIKDLISI